MAYFTRLNLRSMICDDGLDLLEKNPPSRVEEILDRVFRAVYEKLGNLRPLSTVLLVILKNN